MKLKKQKIQWECRYSVTNEDDKHGRWARVAYAGRFGNLGIFKNHICRWEIGWIKKLKGEN